MEDKFLPVSLKEFREEGPITWTFVKERKAKWIDFSYETGSIDMAISADPRFVVNDICYEVGKQFFILDSGKSIRLIVGVELKVQ